MIFNLLLSLIFLLIFQPLAFFMKISLKYDPLNLQKKNKKTYKISRDKIEIDLNSL